MNQSITLAVQNVRFDGDANIVFDLSVTLPSAATGSKYLTAGVYDEDGNSVLVDPADKHINFDSTSEAVVNDLVIDSAKVDRGEEVTVLVKGATGKEAELSVTIPSAATDADYFSMGEVTEVVDGNGRVLAANEDGSYAIAVGETLKSVSVKPAMLDLDEPVKVDAGIMYAAAQSGKDADELTYSTSSLAGQPAGTYYAKVPGTGTYTGGAVYVKIVVEAEQLGDIYAVEGTDVEDTTLDFIPGASSVGNITVGFASDEKMLASSDIADIKVFGSDGKEVSGSSYSTGSVTMPSLPGEYQAKISFAATSQFGAATKVVDFTINKLDLSKVNFSIANATSAVSDLKGALLVDGQAASSDLTALIDVDLVSDELGATASEKGTYEVKIAPKAGNAYIDATDSANPVYYKVSDLVEGSKTVSFDITDSTVAAANFTYAGVQFSSFFDADDANIQREFVNDGESDPFTPSLIKVVETAQTATEPAKYFSSDQVEVTVEKKNADGSWSEVSSYTAAGDYRVTVKVLGSETGYEFGGSQTGYFHVTNGNLNYSDVFVTFEGEAVTDGSVLTTYDGKNALEDLSIVVRSGDKTLVEGTDYKVEVKKDGKAVTEAVDAGDYAVSVTSDSYDGVNATIDIKVDKLEVTGARVDSPRYLAQGDLAYTGSEITPGIEVEYAGNAFGGDYESMVLPADSYKLTGLKYSADGETFENVDSVKEAGDYEATVTVYGDAVNFKAAQSFDIKFSVVKTVAGFADVEANEWYAEAVYDANDNDYMTGLAGTKLFAPTAQISRAEVAQVFYNMAGAKIDGDHNVNEGFDDVTPGIDWFANAVAWASSVGIVTGYDDSGLFGPTDAATREQVATMIYRYAKAMNMDASVADADAALAKYADGASVSDWAKDAMAWCVEQGVFGVDVDSLRPQDNLSRAEMAATAVRVQPTKLS